MLNVISKVAIKKMALKIQRKNREIKMVHYKKKKSKSLLPKKKVMEELKNKNM